MDLMQRRRQLMGMQTGELPGEYKRVEYLESSGTQVIYTDVPARGGIECKAKVAWVSGGANDATIFGGRKSNSDRILLIHQYPSMKWTIGYGSSHVALADLRYGTIYNVSAKVAPGEQFLKIDGKTIYTGTDAAQYSNDFNMSLFACTYNAESIYSLKASARIYNLTASLDGNKVMNVIPCVRKADSKPGMYDTVSNTFFTNAGTGEFIVPN